MRQINDSLGTDNAVLKKRREHTILQPRTEFESPSSLSLGLSTPIIYGGLLAREAADKDGANNYFCVNAALLRTGFT